MYEAVVVKKWDKIKVKISTQKSSNMIPDSWL